MSWKYNSHQALQEAGYVWRSSGVCEKCYQRILWYTNVDRNLVPVNPGTFMIHFATCKPFTKEAAQPGKIVAIDAVRHKTREFIFDPPEPAA